MSRLNSESSHRIFIEAHRILDKNYFRARGYELFFPCINWILNKMLIKSDDEPTSTSTTPALTEPSRNGE